MSIIMLSSIPFRSFSTASGNVYVADQYGIIPNVATASDQTDLSNAGCSTLNPNPTDLLGRLIGANFNVTTDQLILPFNGSVKYQIRRIAVLNASLSLTTAVGGLYPALAKGGTAIVPNTQVYSGLTNAAKAIDLTVTDPTVVYAANTPVYLSLTTPQGVAATADVYVFGTTLPSP